MVKAWWFTSCTVFKEEVLQSCLLKQAVSNVPNINKAVYNPLSPKNTNLVIYLQRVHFTLEQAMKFQRGSRGIAQLFSLTSVLDGGGAMQCHTLAALRPETKTSIHHTGS
jgi:hypothetical protein